ncbi:MULTISPECIES: hypothetical protein [unclassified Polaribacter]|uniref:hypothetical protein n=1 Tax=unclassified Polaribacter TaxID=196858 RepID=UPI0011BEF662|nr:MULTISPECIES: hypothetical protein [unclassified Polaribacter]TXD53218.1 hypothetical protein ES043_05105 [Polaribacter sp. IC063]TXD61365.1 hypothetical protein ES044_05075 [Polaribacter sp. IC066]
MKHIAIALILFISVHIHSQDKQWAAILGIDEGGIILIDQNSFIGVIGAATISYGLIKYVLGMIKI